MTSSAIFPDGKTVLTGHDDSKASLWDATAGQELLELSGHASWVASAAFSADGRLIVTGSEDGTARLWDPDYHGTIGYACSMLSRDLTGDEQAQYDIGDAKPTCQDP